MLKSDFSGRLERKSLSDSIAKFILVPLIDPDLSTRKINSPGASYSSSSESVFFTSSSVKSFFVEGIKLIIAATSSGYFSHSQTII